MELNLCPTDRVAHQKFYKIGIERPLLEPGDGGREVVAAAPGRLTRA